MRIAILGAGAWGSALAINLSSYHQINLWTRNSHHAAEMVATGINQRYLPHYVLPKTVTVSAILADALKEVDFALIVVPISGLRETLREIIVSRIKLPLLWGCKGFEPSTAKLPHQIIQEECPGRMSQCGVLSGPSFADEVARNLPTALTLASTDIEFSKQLAASLHSSKLRIYTSRDVIGVEIGGAIKNVISIAAGISDGLGFGSNARAALITRGLSEITRLGLKLGGDLKTFMGLTGIGDLILTSTGQLSRNRRVGLMLAEGKSIDEILAQLGHVAEGVHTTQSVLQLGDQLNIEMPITQAVYSILHERVSPRSAVEVLLNREQKTETY
ncbi:glycerol 3-phosphate dehydrogenase (NAD(P)+) [Nitrosomonas sp. PY1]|uniref:NAD(P)H-dependent glycerol-3-phosphate dehydrogenase n=1 Tax=Nitrosomonas sp. PY1 TaxID=1803906 RepID=UPI001FC8CFFB|nr:NAD(P)H-dependent glycerol-3-phosphate dehydrogenase [Nitrosomonas sp. PY1]GKS69738.1 glycerol 3-phosphate dehydrogenase (NAD(P)+) [Nitrosomonas sp. PY1]